MSWDIKCIEFSAKNPSMQTAYSQEARQRLENIKIEHVAALIPGGQYVLASILLCIFLLTWLFVNSKLKTIFSVNVKFQKPFETRKHNERYIFESLRSSTLLCHRFLFSVLLISQPDIKNLVWQLATQVLQSSTGVTGQSWTGKIFFFQVCIQSSLLQFKLISTRRPNGTLPTSVFSSQVPSWL